MLKCFKYSPTNEFLLGTSELLSSLNLRKPKLLETSMVWLYLSGGVNSLLAVRLLLNALKVFLRAAFANKVAARSSSLSIPSVGVAASVLSNCGKLEEPE